MPNINNSYIEISLQSEECELTQAQKQVRWELWKKIHAMIISGDLTDEDGLFQIIKPRPKEEEDNWREWNTENWGCKWDINIEEFYHGELTPYKESITIVGTTPWGPPIPILTELVRLGFNVHHQFTSEAGYWGNEFFWEGEESENWGDFNPNPLHDITTLPDSLRNFKNHMEENPDEDINELMFGFVMTGEIGYDVLDFYNFNNKEYFFEQLEHVILHNVDEYYEYFDHEPLLATEDEEKLKTSRTQIMEKIEYLNEKEAIDEGTYLNMCNLLGEIDIKSVLAKEKLLVMKASSDLLFNQYYDQSFHMTNYYDGEYHLPLVEFY